MGWVNKNVWIDELDDGMITHFNFLRRVSAKHSLRRQSRRKAKIKRLFRLG
jgi:hypothetical protein